MSSDPRAARRRTLRAARRILSGGTLLLLAAAGFTILGLPAEEDFPVPPPPFSDGIFPCSDCHADMEVDRERRPLEMMHEDIVLKHGPASRWCLDCHDAENRDLLHLASGETIDFSHSYILCGQCHGPKLRDWRAGVHGKRTGDWNGRKQYLLCAHCHDPHSPHFKPIKPEPPPVRPEDLR